MSKIKDLVKIRIKSLNSDQLSLYKDMQSNDLLQVCIPTGAGKGYLMMVDLLNQVVNTKNKIFAISSHRLMLNTQHMNDVFEILSPLIGKIGFVFVGSSKYDVDKFQDNIEFNKSLLKKHLSYNEIVGSTTNKKEVDKLVEGHIEAGRKVVILSTYHSLHTLANVDIDTIYNDEAHTLASDGDTKFQDNFEQVSYERCFFLTATPKDCVEDTETFLMNNFEVFGERVGLTFKHCVEMGYIVKPVIHVVIPSNLNYEVEFKSIENMIKLQRHISNAMVVGDKRKFLIAVITIDRDIFLQELDELGLSGQPTYEDLAINSKVYDIINQEIESTNKDLASFESIKGFYIASKDFTIESGHITPSLKLKKKIILKSYADEIDALYKKLES